MTPDPPSGSGRLREREVLSALRITQTRNRAYTICGSRLRAAGYVSGVGKEPGARLSLPDNVLRASFDSDPSLSRNVIGDPSVSVRVPEVT